uniref:DUF19 domain-containing protein n=2 Tax=Parascaris univalens TaxID=6257 RepID=A0A915BBH3_PARUN
LSGSSHCLQSSSTVALNSVGMLILVIFISSSTFIGATNPQCQRYNICISMVRSDYEHCIGGVGAALIADHEDTLRINELLRQSRDIFECEKHNEQAIKELKVIRELEDEDILRCTATNDFNTRIGEIRKIACAGTPIPSSLQEFAKNILEEPSQCRELYLLQRERCAFILDCCPEYSECMERVANTSLTHSELLRRSYSLSGKTKNCLKRRNAAHDDITKAQEIEHIEDSAVPTFRLSVEKQRKRIESALNDLSTITSTMSSTANSTKKLETQTTTSTSTLFPTLPTLPPLPDVFALLFPQLTTTTTPHPATAPNKETTPKAEFIDDAIDVSTAVNRVHLNESDGDVYCLETLKCESELMKFRTECTLKYPINITREGLSRMLLRADAYKSSAISGATEAIRRSCELPTNTAIVTQLIEIVDQLESQRIECIQQHIHHPMTVTETDRNICDAMPSKAFTDGVQLNMTAVNRTIGLSMNYDSCEEQLTTINERCLHLKRCCPISKM